MAAACSSESSSPAVSGSSMYVVLRMGAALASVTNRVPTCTPSSFVAHLHDRELECGQTVLASRRTQRSQTQLQRTVPLLPRCAAPSVSARKKGSRGYRPSIYALSAYRQTQR